MITITTLKERKHPCYKSFMEMNMAMQFEPSTATREQLIDDLKREIKMRFSGDGEKNFQRTINQFTRVYEEDGIKPSDYIRNHNLGLHYTSICDSLDNLIINA